MIEEREKVMKKINLVALVAFLAFALSQLSCAQTPPAPPISTDTAPAFDAAWSVTDTPVMPDQQTVLWRWMAAGRSKAPMLADTRSHEQIAAAACTGPNGQWRCKGARPMASSGQPIIPASWTVPHWYIDPANVTTTASDSNDCVTSATACLTCQEVETHRWGTYSPRLRQTTTITGLSTQPGNGASDPCYFTTYGENSGGMLIFQGVLNSTTQVATGTITVTAAKNRNTPQLLNATLPAGGAIGQFVVNSTHASAAWIYKNVSGNTWAMSQPFIQQTVPIPAANDPPAEVDTWTTGDTVTMYSLVGFNIARWSNVQEAIDSTFSTATYATLQDVSILDPVSGTGDQLLVETPQFFAVETSFGRFLTLNNTIGDLGPGLFNCIYPGGFSSGATADSGDISVNGGYIPSAGFSFLGGVNVDGDFIMGVSAPNFNGGGLGTVYLDTGVIATNARIYNADLYIISSAYNGGQAVVWGPGLLDCSGTAQCIFKSGAGQAGTTFKNTGGLRLNQQSVACNGTGANFLSGAGTVNANANCNITINTTNLDAAFGSTGFGGHAWQLGGASFLNTWTR